eukprot:360291-Chlamydomonas_euryale.AAC.12
MNRYTTIMLRYYMSLQLQKENEKGMTCSQITTCLLDTLGMPQTADATAGAAVTGTAFEVAAAEVHTAEMAVDGMEPAERVAAEVATAEAAAAAAGCVGAVPVAASAPSATCDLACAPHPSGNASGLATAPCDATPCVGITGDQDELAPPQLGAWLCDVACVSALGGGLSLPPAGTLGGMLCPADGIAPGEMVPMGTGCCTGMPAP